MAARVSSTAASNARRERAPCNASFLKGASSVHSNRGTHGRADKSAPERANADSFSLLRLHAGHGPNLHTRSMDYTCTTHVLHMYYYTCTTSTINQNSLRSADSLVTLARRRLCRRVLHRYSAPARGVSQCGIPHTMVDHSPIPTPVYWSLWISAIVYTPIGLSMLFNAHFAKFTPAWAKDNQAVQLALSTYQGGYAVALLILSYVCIDALIAGSITTLEIEIEMLSVCAFAGLLFKLTSPGRLAWLVPLLKPETYLSACVLLTRAPVLHTAPCCLASAKASRSIGLR